MPGNTHSTQDETHTLAKRIRRRTHHRLRNVEVLRTSNGIQITATSPTYYVVQLAVAAVRDFIAERADVPNARLLFHVNGRPVKLRLVNGSECEPDRALRKQVRPRRREGKIGSDRALVTH